MVSKLQKSAGTEFLAETGAKAMISGWFFSADLWSGWDVYAATNGEGRFEFAGLSREQDPCWPVTWRSCPGARAELLRFPVREDVGIASVTFFRSRLLSF